MNKLTGNVKRVSVLFLLLAITDFLYAERIVSFGTRAGLGVFSSKSSSSFSLRGNTYNISIEQTQTIISPIGFSLSYQYYPDGKSIGMHAETNFLILTNGESTTVSNNSLYPIADNGTFDLTTGVGIHSRIGLSFKMQGKTIGLRGAIGPIFSSYRAITDMDTDTALLSLGVYDQVAVFIDFKSPLYIDFGVDVSISWPLLFSQSTYLNGTYYTADISDLDSLVLFSLMGFLNVGYRF